MNEADTEALDQEGEAADADLDAAEEQADQGEESGAEGEEGDGESEGGETDEVTVTIGEDSPASDEDDLHGKPAPEWVKEVRKQNRELARRNRELEEKLSTATPAAKPVEVGAKPTLADCDYDAARFEQELEAWHQRKRDGDAQEEQKRKDTQTAQAAWQSKLDAYNKAKAELKVKNIDEIEATALEILSVTQQGVILQGAKNAAVLVAAIGLNPKKAKELAAITDPVKFAWAAAQLETQLKVTPRKAAPLPEKTVRGSSPLSGTVDNQLERLRAEAAKTGDLSKVMAYRNAQRAKQRA